MFGSSTKRGTGVHMADGALHVVGLVREQSRTALDGLVRLPLSHTDHLGQLADEECCQEFVQALTDSRDHLGDAFHNVFFAFDGPSAFLKRRARVSPNDRQAREHLQWEAEQFLADAAEEYVIDFLLSGRHGFIVAVRRAAMELVATAFARAGLDRPGFDIATLALCNALEASGLSPTQGFEVLIDLGREEAELALLHNGRLRDVWTCPWGPVPSIAGGDEEEDAAPEGLFEDGGADDGVRSDIGNTPPEGQAGPDDERVERLQQELEQMAMGIGRDQEVQGVWLTGEAAGEGWLESLSPHVAAQVRLLDPLAAIAPPGEPGRDEAVAAPAPGFAAAVGLAFRALAEA